MLIVTLFNTLTMFQLCNFLYIFLQNFIIFQRYLCSYVSYLSYIYFNIFSYISNNFNSVMQVVSTFEALLFKITQVLQLCTRTSISLSIHGPLTQLQAKSFIYTLPKYAEVKINQFFMNFRNYNSTFF